MKAVALKLVLRSWWRNKTFSIISIVSLAIGIACTNLLAAFVIYEFNIEADNPNKEKIVYMAQDSPMKSGEKVSFIVGEIPILLKEQYTEVEDYLRFSSIDCNSVTIGNKKYDPILITRTDTTFARFFEYEVLYGNLHDALSAPDKAALSESCARKLFGKTNPVGKIVQIDLADGGMRQENEITPFSRPFQIAAVLKEHPQSYLKFDMLTGIGQDYYGGVALPKGLPLVRQRSIRPKDQGRRRPYAATGERTLLFLLLARILFPALPARVDSLYRPFPTIAVTHRADIRIADPADRLLQLYQPQLLPDPSTDTDHTHAETDGSHTSGDELPAVSGYIPHGRHRFPAIVADRPRPDPRFQPDHVREDHHRIFPEQAGVACHLWTDPDPVRYPCLLHEPENHQPDG